MPNILTMKKQLLSEEFLRMQKLAGILTEAQNTKSISLTPQEKKIVDDLLVLEEGTFNLDKLKTYLKTGTITAGILISLIGGTQLTQGQKKDIVNTVKKEQTKNPDLEYIANARFAITMYQQYKAQMDKAAEKDASFKSLVNELDNTIKQNLTDDEFNLKMIGKDYKTQIDSLTNKIF